MTESEEIIGFNLDLVAERPLVAQTRFAEDGGIGVDWRGRCWAWLNGDEAQALAEVVVNDAETARGLHEGGKVRILGGTVQQGLSGKVGTLLRYTSATVEVDGRRYGVGVRGLEPVGGGNGPEEAAVGLD